MQVTSNYYFISVFESRRLYDMMAYIYDEQEIVIVVIVIILTQTVIEIAA